MKSLTLLLVSCLLAGVVSPVMAQSEAIQTPCEPIERATISESLLNYSDEVSRVLNSVDTSEEGILQNIGNAIVEYDTIMQEDAPKTFPACVDGILAEDYVNVLDLNTMNFLTLVGLALYVMIYGEEDIAQQFLDAGITRQEWLVMQANLTQLGTGIAQNAFFPNGIPVCDEEIANAQLNLYTSEIEAYQAALPEYNTFIETNRGDFGTLFSFETIALETLTYETEVCANTWEFEMLYIELYTATSLTVLLPQVAAYERIYGDATIADQLDAIAERYQGIVAELSPLLLPQ